MSENSEAEAIAKANTAAANAAASASEARSLTENLDKARAAHSFEDRVVSQDVHGDESIKAGLADQTNAWGANRKRTFDEYQNESLNDSRTFRNLSTQAIQNAIETANMVSKQAVRHSDLAIDRQWNSDQEAFLVLLAREVAKSQE